MAGGTSRLRVPCMHAQVIEGGTTPELRDKMDRIVSDEMPPALSDEPGFAGAMNLVHRDSGDAMMIVLWGIETQARRELSHNGGAFLQALANVAAITTGTRRPISIWGATRAREESGHPVEEALSHLAVRGVARRLQQHPLRVRDAV